MTALPALLSAALALALVVGLILLIGRLARMRGLAAPAGGGRLTTLAKLPIDPRRRLLLIECDGRRILLLTGRGESMIALDP